MNFSVFEIRNYVLQPNMREHFIDYFEATFITTQAAVNMHTLGQFRLLGGPDHFVWMRAYENMQARHEGLHAFYDGGAVWKQHRSRTNGMLVDSDNVHLLRPLDENLDLTCGQTAETIAAALADSSISTDTGMIVVDILQAIPGKREALIDTFQSKIAPVYHDEGIQVRGTFVAEMSKNTFPRHPAFQNEHELVVITAYPDEEQGQDTRDRLSPSISVPLRGLLSKPPETLFLSPTLRSPLRYQPI